MARYPAEALLREKRRLSTIGKNLLLGICGDANHSFGYHLPANELSSSDYSRQGSYNNPVGDWSACSAIDISMNWPASRHWLKWLITQKRKGNIPGVTEVIGSLNSDGSNVRYWSMTDTPKWQSNGVKYHGSGHDRWTHVSIGREWPTRDHGILKGWTRSGYEGDGMKLTDKIKVPDWARKKWPSLSKSETVRTYLASGYSHARNASDKSDVIRGKVDALSDKVDAQAKQLAEIKALLQQRS